MFCGVELRALVCQYSVNYLRMGQEDFGMTDITYDSLEEFETKLEEALGASNEFLGFNYGQEEIEQTAEGVAKILASGNENPTYSDIDKWMEKAHSRGDPLEESIKLQALTEYNLNL
ncbi:MAG: hypothetical protein ACI8Z7_000307 [Candidatus Nanohaloarchaea archaeon]